MPTRRETIRAGLLAGGSLAVVGCEPIISGASRKLGETVPNTLAIPGGDAVDPTFNLLNRAAYGVWPGDLSRVRAMGAEGWIDSQLDFANIDDIPCDLRARRFDSVHVRPEFAYNFKRKTLRSEIVRHTLLRAIYSRRQLFEVMVGFWNDHLNIDLDKGDCLYFKPTDDREVIRRHALGKFSEMVRASATSGAMLEYLDGKSNRFREGKGDIPNENYARELLELHTMGVDGGYTQNDVSEAARCLTGWRLKTGGFSLGKIWFDPGFHDGGAKNVLGATIPERGERVRMPDWVSEGLRREWDGKEYAGGEADTDLLVALACDHPATARYLAGKLCRRFVSYDPPAALLDSAATVFTKTSGDIAEVVRHILTSDGFANSAGARFKRPFRFVVSALRALGADTHAHPGLSQFLTRFGQVPFQYPTPDGYPDEEEPWTGTLMTRWNLAFALAADGVPSVSVDWKVLRGALGDGGDQVERVFAYLCGRLPNAREKEVLVEFLQQPGHGGSTGSGARENADRKALRQELIGLILASPAFQRC